MGLSEGLRAGVLFGGTIRDNYRENQKEEASGSILQAYEEMQREREIVDAEGRKLTQEAVDFSQMNGDEIMSTVLNGVKQRGGEINDQTYMIAYELGNTFQEQKDKRLINEAKQDYIGLQQQNLENTIFNRNSANARREEQFELSKSGRWKPSGQKRTLTKPDGYDVPVDEAGATDYKKIRVGSKLFNALDPDSKNEVRKSHGLKGSYTPARGSSDSSGASIFDNPPEDETPAPSAKPSAKPKRTSVGNSPKGIKNGKYKVRGKNIEVVDGVMYPL